MIAEVLIYVPSIARFRLNWLEGRLADAHLAALALEATPSGAIGPDLERRLLEYTKSYAIELKMGEFYTHMLGGMEPPAPDAMYDLHRVNTVGLIRDALATLIHDREQVIAVNGASPPDPRTEERSVGTKGGQQVSIW